MLISFDALEAVTIPRLNGGEGAVSAKMFLDSDIKIMISRLPAGASIGLHRHTSSCEINYVISGTGRAICAGEEETLTGGVCHYCPKGASHSIINTGGADLVLLTVVPELPSLSARQEPPA